MPAAPLRGADESAGDFSAAGIVEGRVLYRPNSSRSWRYSRYYVKDTKSGELAEAVVALKGKTLRATHEATPATFSLDQKDYQFQPELVAIRQGDSVKFTNSDPAAHNVRCSGELANFNVTIPVDGEGHTVRFDRAGGIRQPAEVGCVFHGNMRAWIFVFDHPYFQVTKADGRFRLRGVPPGEYELEMVHPAGGFQARRQVVVKAGETTSADFVVSSPDIK
jgi:plastocyanin